MSKSDAEPESPAPRFVGEGFHVEPDFRVEPDYRTESGASVYDPNTGPVAGTGLGASGASESAESSAGLPGRTTALALPSASTSEGGPSAAELNNAFDDPQHGEPGRDRLAAHAIWEIVLLIAAVVVGILLNQKSHLGNSDIRGLLVLASVYGVVAMAAGLSLRAGAVNLAVGPIMVGSGLYFAQQHANHNFWTSAGLALLVAAGVGAGIAVVVTILHVPGWAASLAAFVCVDVWITHLPAKVTVSGGPDVLGNGYYVFAVVAAVGILCGLAGSFRPVRRTIGRYRSVSDPADRRGPIAAWTTGVALVISSVLAAVAGILYALSNTSVATDNGLIWSVTAVAVALVGGTSAFGRRGGIFGTILAACLFVVVIDYEKLTTWRIDERLILGGALLLGLIVTRGVEIFGRPPRLYSEVSTSGWLRGSAPRWSEDEGKPTAAATTSSSGESDNPWGATT